MFDIFDWLISSHSQILISLGSCAFSCILASSHPHILVCVYLLVSSHPYILVSSGSYPLSCILIGAGSCALACILASSHPHMLRLIIVSLYIRMLISSDSCVFACILASSYPQIYVCLLVSSHPHIHRFMCASMLISSGQCVLDTNNCILAFSSSLVLGNCVSQVPVKESIF